MAEPSVFDKLVAGLSSGERQEMLARIAASTNDEVPEVEPELPQVPDLDEAYVKMGLFRKLMVLLIAFFTGRDKLSVVESQLLQDLRRGVAARLPHGYDVSNDLIRPGAAEDFRQLSRDARQFSAILGRVMGKERQAFIAFLVGLHAPDLQSRLIAETDPSQIAGRDADLKEFEIKRHSLSAMESIVATMTPDTRRGIYSDVRALHHMLALSSFQFDRVTSAFMPVSGGDAVPVPVSRVAEELARLASLLDGLRGGPSTRLFEALSLYDRQDRLDQPDDDVETLVQEDVGRFLKAYGGIHSFGRRYPITDLVRIALSNVHYRPTPQPGGEDWFAQWKSFWKERLENQNRRFAHQRRVQILREEAIASLNLASVDPFPGYPEFEGDETPRYALSAGLLRAIMGDLYRSEIAPPLAVLYRDGEFYKSDNRTELDNTMHALDRLQTDVANLEVRLRSTGDLGMALSQAAKEELSPQESRERQATVLRTVDSEASALLHRSVEAFRSIGNLLQGVLYGTVGGRYDTISNLGTIGGRDPKAYIRQLENTHVRSKRASELIGELQNVESLQAP